MKRTATLSLMALILLAFSVNALAIVPRLQTYIVGSKYYNHYMNDRYSWITNSQSFDLKVVGYWKAGQPGLIAGQYGALSTNSAPGFDKLDCWLGISVPRGQSGRVWINGVEINSFSGYRAAAAALPDYVHPRPTLPFQRPQRHGKFHFFDVGAIDNDQIGAMQYRHGHIMSPGWGDEILLNVVIRGFDWVHFDAVGYSASRGRSYTTWPSWDSSFYATPEPGTLSLLGIGLLGLAPLLRRKRK